MGYYTSYSLTIERADQETREKICSVMEENRDIKSFMIATEDDYAYFYSCEPVKWYDHEKDIAEISAKFPGVLFVLEGEGEDNRDMWTKYFLNGKVQRCPAKIEFDEFDESKMEEVT